MPPLALVTGASKGHGAVLAAFLAGLGYDLVVTARDETALDERADALAAFEVRVVAVAGDVADPDHRAELRELVEARGSLDLLVNNASALGPSPLPPLSEYPLDEFERVLGVNVVAPLALTRALLPALREAGGLVVNVTSDAAVEGYPGWGGYGASKAALDQLTRALAAEESEVGVASVDPGDLRTDMHQRAFPGEDISDRPLPEITLPFWAWLLGRDPLDVTGRRFEAQGERWEA
ncbi:SDR family NAD(P)-dependent oxidoreductase [Halegenticoccus tardaugens]|uniref:SDR family NAD(P)-dependent oxidoreductase n=1 Tax=Halegenticoccus tardaugens TaxID=2071624 RepID=UPI00100B2D9D|nr:SDR family oxidoreductase [Halegenticoccus tardaugens]